MLKQEWKERMQRLLNLTENPEASNQSDQDQAGELVQLVQLVQDQSEQPDQSDQDQAEELVQSVQDQAEELVQSDQDQPDQSDHDQLLSELIKGFCQGRNLGPEFAEKLSDTLTELRATLQKGEIDLDTIEFIFKGMNHDKDVALARHEGEIAGRNAGIKAYLAEQEPSDGLPAPGGASVRPSGSSSSIFSLAGLAR